MTFRYDARKNDWLAKERNITFEDAIKAISDNGILADYDHPNQEKYPTQRIMVVAINGYPHCIPYTVEGDLIEMKTVFPSRKFLYLMRGETDGR